MEVILKPKEWLESTRHQFRSVKDYVNGHVRFPTKVIRLKDSQDFNFYTSYLYQGEDVQIAEFLEDMIHVVVFDLDNVTTEIEINELTQF